MKERKKREERKTWRYSLLRDSIVKFQRLNIEGLANFGNNSKWKGNEERKENGSNNL